MTHLPDDLAERGRSIFEALRRAVEPPQDPDDDAGAVPTKGGDEESSSEGPSAPIGAFPQVSGPDADVSRETMPPRTEDEPAEATTPDSPAGDAEPVAHASPIGAPPAPPTAHDTVTATPPGPDLDREAHGAADGVRPEEAADDEGPIPVLEVPEDSAPLPPMTLPRIIAIANQKGGVGKTTTSVNLGAGLAELGFRVLVVDLDPQGNASTGLGINNRNLDASIYDVIMNDVPIEDCIEPTSLRNLFVAPATIDLAGAEIELVPAFSRELKLRRALYEVRDDYDITIIDCPPSLGLLTVNGLAAADDVIVPIQCEYYALEGLGQLLKNVALVRTNLNQSLEVRGIVLTMYDARTKLSDAVARDVRQHFGAKVYRNIVPRTVRLSEAPSFGQPITVFDPSSRGAIAYRELAKEVSRGATRRTG